MPPGMVDYNPILFKELYTKVESRTKRALNSGADATVRKLQNSVRCRYRNSVYLLLFMLMFMLRGMPFIDLAHLRETELARQAYCLPASQDR